VRAHPPQLPGGAARAGGAAPQPGWPRAGAAAQWRRPAGSQPALRAAAAAGPAAALNGRRGRAGTGTGRPRKAPAASIADNARMDTLRIATRKSPLALWQSEHVAARLRAAHPGLEVVLVPLSTRGDEVLDRSLAAIGGKGLFLKELELAMERGEADCAVHSLKDVPMELEPGFVLPAVLERADPADAFVSNAYPDLDALPQGAVVGTSSLRRQAQLRARRP